MNFDYEIDRKGCHPSVRVKLHDIGEPLYLSCHYGVAYTLELPAGEMSGEFLKYVMKNEDFFWTAVEELASAWAVSLDRRMYRACQLMDKKLDDIEDNI